ncbi:hypothetical protein CKO43_18285 [Rubrivivax gelatinosus]|uniref:HTH gntR-type domain-containing protein n=1 Tax=Rubrivivax gelatinosus TaxID=28068 RepID=A0ABS1DYI6_RUBGE|nr:GntR family transcriptional regulator [Rubrivivax gelatinosus]MBK1714715.1 hypothetical protein [Rubrivivax gelatinosus]
MVPAGTKPPRARRRLRPPALCELVADDLRRRILRHEFAAGADLDETRLAVHYGVSRTPVREALKLLNHEGLLVGQPRRGLSVVTVDEAEMAEARALLRLLDSEPGGALRARLTAWLRQRLQLGAGRAA